MDLTINTKQVEPADTVGLDYPTLWMYLLANPDDTQCQLYEAAVTYALLYETVGLSWMAPRRVVGGNVSHAWLGVVATRAWGRESWDIVDGVFVGKGWQA